ncbi:MULTISPECIES: hypothetical protein [Bifidobacterium]|uniref:Uncharacterized protein n=1 Tax=Bifidobacterium asteroides TaxID=1684 RepID=A0A556RCS3_9BIFI|nr:MULTISPECIES: hypothetical protein [Bifidobacterium]MBI0085845.1 hypothetical protein [Bifidobacterium sp. M0404]TSJ86684.1 hypothetical protein FPK29_03180 [Bifidobacterium polysaccharolyticum]
MMDPQTYRIYTNVLQNHLADCQDKPMTQFTPSTVTRILATVKVPRPKGADIAQCWDQPEKAAEIDSSLFFEDVKRNRTISPNPAEKLPSFKERMHNIRRSRTRKNYLQCARDEIDATRRSSHA